MRLAWLLAILLIMLACNVPSASTPTPNLLATLSAVTALPADSTLQPDIVPSSISEPTGKIAFVCQIFKAQASNQICIIHADGSGFQRLTTDDTRQHYWPQSAFQCEICPFHCRRGDPLSLSTGHG